MMVLRSCLIASPTCSRDQGPSAKRDGHCKVKENEAAELIAFKDERKRLKEGCKIKKASCPQKIYMGGWAADEEQR